MIRIITPYFIILTSAMHIFCCGIPLVLSITSLTATLGISSLEFFELQWFESIEELLLIASGALLAITFAIDYISKKLDCLKDGACTHLPCGEKKKRSSNIFKIAVTLYAINLLTIFGNTVIA